MPLNDEFKYDQAVIFLTSGDFGWAEMLFLEIVEHDENYIEAWINLSVCRLESESLEKAIDTIELALKSNKEEASLWYRLAAYLFKSGKVQQAYFYIEAALKLNKEKYIELVEFLPELVNEPRFVELLGIYKAG
jgi:tetratricopeptide (TPR) repeat protein